MRICASLCVLAVSVACVDNAACLAYTDAFEACIAEADANDVPTDVDLTDPDGFCREFDATGDETWECLEAAYDAGDCSTAEGLAAAQDVADACGPVQ